MRKIFLALAMVLLSPVRSWACAACGCTLSSDWFTSTEKGLKLDLRYDYVNQNQLRSGTSTITSSAASAMLNNGDPQEVEKYTVNNYLTATADYTITPDWKIDAILPYIIRDHSTLGTASNGGAGGPGGGQYDSNTSNLGDVKLIGSFQGLLPEHNLGLQFGLKLPTGPFNLTGNSTDATAPGRIPIDRGLQPGTGTTDFIVGVYYTRAVSKNWDIYTQDTYQFALNSRDDYRPGDGLNLNIGFRYLEYSYFIPQLQLNGRYVKHDTGANADKFSTGGTLVYLSPGVTVPIDDKLSAYVFVQLPIYQYLEGVQVAPTYLASLGVRYAF